MDSDTIDQYLNKQGYTGSRTRLPKSIQESTFYDSDIYDILKKKYLFTDIWNDPQVWRTKAELITNGRPIMANGNWKDGLLDYLLYKELFNAVQEEPYVVDPQRIRLLVGDGANPNMITPWIFGYSLLHVIIMGLGQTQTGRRDIGLLKYILDHGGDVNILDSQDAQTPLDYTDSYPDMSHVSELLQKYGGITQEEWKTEVFDDKLETIKERNKLRYGQEYEYLYSIFNNGQVSDKYRLPKSGSSTI